MESNYCRIKLVRTQIYFHSINWWPILSENISEAKFMQILTLILVLMVTMVLK